VLLGYRAKGSGLRPAAAAGLLRGLAVLHGMGCWPVGLDGGGLGGIGFRNLRVLGFFLKKDSNKRIPNIEFEF
jgi:hypothetical protein